MFTLTNIIIFIKYIDLWLIKKIFILFLHIVKSKTIIQNFMYSMSAFIYLMKEKKGNIKLSKGDLVLPWGFQSAFSTHPCI